MFFTLNDNFEKIIKENLQNDEIIIKKIPTGWTNYVFKAIVSKRKSFIFRFPRNDFFAKTLLKEETFCNFFKAKKILSFKIPDIHLFYHNERPFTVHRFMEGKSLTECASNLNHEEKVQLGKDIAKFIYELQHATNEILKLPRLSEFLDGLSKVGNAEYDLSRHDVLKNLENESLVLSHADFNPGNILLNKKNRMFAVLDFAFISYTSPVVDILRVVGRLPQDYHDVLIEQYQNYCNSKIDTKKACEIIDLWKYVEERYINYMKNNHPDVILPAFHN